MSTTDAVPTDDPAVAHSGHSFTGSDVAWAARCPASIQAVRAAQARLGCDIELVLLGRTRAAVSAASGDAVLQPRPLNATEEALLNSIDDLAVTSTGTAVHVPIDGRAVTAALVASRPLSEREQGTLSGIALMAGSRLATWQSESSREFNTDAILSGLRDVVLVLDDKFTITWCNDAVVTLVGWTPQEIIGTAIADLLHPDDIESTLQSAIELRAAQEVYRVQARVKNAFGEWEQVAITGLDHSDNPGIGGMLVSVRSGDRETEIDRKLDKSMRMSASILANLDDAVVVTNRLGAITMLNSSARRFFDIAADTALDELTTDDFALLSVDGRSLPRDEHPLRHSAPATTEFRIGQSDANRYVCVTSARVDDASADRIGTVVTFHDVTQSRTNAAILRERASHDQLTGLPNRERLVEWLTAVDRSDPSRSVGAFLIELDRFKSVNDIHGHAVGDAVLVEVGARLEDMLSEDELAARVGGDQFVVAVVGTRGQGSLAAIADQIRRELGRPFEAAGHQLLLTSSIGIAAQFASALDPARLLQEADLAARATRTSGGDGYEHFGQELRRRTALLQEQRNLVHDALENERLLIHFQPIVDGSDAIVGLEALSRCQSAQGEVILPAGFLDATIGTNLIVQLDHHALNQACAAAKTLTGNEVWISTNFSAASLAQSGLARTVLGAVERHNIEPHRICIEVTESAAFDANPLAIGELRLLREAGVRIALDDFGTGYSSLSHLRDLPLTSVKIDRSFTSALGTPGPEHAIVAAVQQLCQSLELLLVVEGVETREHSQAIKALGLEHKQGWLYSGAVPLDEIKTLLDASVE